GPPPATPREARSKPSGAVLRHGHAAPSRAAGRAHPSRVGPRGSAAGARSQHGRARDLRPAVTWLDGTPRKPEGPTSRLPEIAAGQDIDERHDREDHEDGPDDLLTAAQVAPAGDVDPGEHYCERVDEADEDLEKFLHARILPR